MNDTKKPYKRNLKGQVFGMLTVIMDTKKVKNKGEQIWLCKCGCTHLIEVPTNALIGGKRISCGCEHKRTGKDKQNKRFKFSDEYLEWRDIVHRYRLKDEPIPGIYKTFIKYLEHIKGEK